MRIPRKSALVVLASISIAGLAGASAAGFGGFTGGKIGSGDSAVAACDTNGVDVSYVSSYNATAQKYVVSGVKVSNVNAACQGKDASVTVRNTAGTISETAGTTVALTALDGTGSFTINLAGTTGAVDVEGVSLVIVG